ncbi:MAG TPA: peptide chain release factor N(5)-glutamine methyltransferase [Candidatus Limnocylindrales bacterium]|nr:peptide chain release factor N(5)-glutamine methyltransferase [Candidatus Limnocylindrales bacterium]
MATVDELLRSAIERLRAAGSESPRLDAELLLGHAIGADRTVIAAHPDALVGDGPAERFQANLARREAGEPVAYIRGFKEFFGQAFATDARALIPRPETERLVELAVGETLRRLAAAPRPEGTPPLRIADVGTGAGTIAVALAVALRGRRVTADIEILATDVSPDALALAVENAVGHSVADRIEFAEADLLPGGVRPFQLVLANLPYIPTADVPGLPVAASFEPRLALDGGPDGLAIIGRLLERLPNMLSHGGVALVEIGSTQKGAASELAGRLLPGWPVSVDPDLAGEPRVLRLERP